MRHIIPIILFLCFYLQSTAKTPDNNAMLFTIMEYNCENLFDCRHDSLKDDTEFLPEGEREWNFSKYWRKLNNIGRVIHQCGDNGTSRHLPDIITMVEVENDSTLFMLTRRSMLRAAGYRYVITQSPDQRGVDVALLYNPLTFELIYHHSIRITPEKGDKPTRDVLYAKGRTRTNDTLHVFVVHAPSRSGGQKATEHYRMKVAQSIINAIDSIRSQQHEAGIIVAGDFNDYNYNKSMKLYNANGMTDVSGNATGKRAKGTYKYQGAWSSLDHILLSAALANKAYDCRIYDPLWLLENDTRGGYKPRRTYLGKHYHGGVSDHLPLVLKMWFLRKNR